MILHWVDIHQGLGTLNCVPCFGAQLRVTSSAIVTTEIKNPPETSDQDQALGEAQKGQSRLNEVRTLYFHLNE